MKSGHLITEKEILNELWKKGALLEYMDEDGVWNEWKFPVRPPFYTGTLYRQKLPVKEHLNNDP
jgi:hypothetical protein